MTRLHGAFLAFGVLFGVWQVLLPDLTQELDITPGTLGAAISLGVLGSLPLMGVAGRLSDRFGATRVGGVAGVALAFALAGFGLATSQANFIVVVFVLYVASGAYDVAINAAAMGAEQGTGRRDLPILHASFSAGGVLGAIGAGIGLAGGVGLQLMYPLTGAAVALAVLAWAATRTPSRRSRHLPEPDAMRSLYRHPILLVLAGTAAIAFLSEGAMESWSAIYLRDALGLSVLVGASGVALFHGAMTIGRLATAGVTRRVGRTRTLVGGGVAVVMGMILVLTALTPVLVLLGIVIVGFGLSGVAPIAFSLAGDASGGRAGQASSVITVVGYAGFLVGPGLIGGIAQVSDLRTALVTILVSGAAIVASAMVVGRRVRDQR